MGGFLQRHLAGLKIALALLFTALGIFVVWTA